MNRTSQTQVRSPSGARSRSAGDAAPSPWGDSPGTLLRRTDHGRLRSARWPVRVGRSPPWDLLGALQVLTLHLGLVSVRLPQEEDELGFVRLSASQPFAEPLELGSRGPKLAQELDCGHRPIPCVFEALEVREGDLERVHDLPGPLVMGVRDIQDQASDHRLGRGIVPEDVRKHGEVVLDRVGPTLEARPRADDRETLLVTAVGQGETLALEAAADLRDRFEERAIELYS